MEELKAACHSLAERNPRPLECSLLPPPAALPLERSPCQPHCLSWSSERGTRCHLCPPGCMSSARPHGMLLASPRFANSVASGISSSKFAAVLFLSLPSPNTVAMVPFSSCCKTWKGHSPYPQGITPTLAWVLSPTLPTLLLRDLLLVTMPLLLL